MPARTRAPRGASPVSGAASRELLAVPQVCAELKVAASTFYEWRARRTGPRCITMSNGRLRVRRSDLTAWLTAREDPGASQWEPGCELLTVAEVTEELQVARSTFDLWRAKGTGPRCVKLPGQLRIRRAELDAWLTAREDAA